MFKVIETEHKAAETANLLLFAIERKIQQDPDWPRRVAAAEVITTEENGTDEYNMEEIFASAVGRLKEVGVAK